MTIKKLQSTETKMQIVSTIIGKEKETTIRICMLTSGPGLKGLINKLTVLFTHLIKMFKF